MILIDFLNENNKEPDSIATLGIASLDINEVSHAGSWNNTVGYDSQSGRCVCSHKINANTSGRPLNKGFNFTDLRKYN